MHARNFIAGRARTILLFGTACLAAGMSFAAGVSAWPADSPALQAGGGGARPAVPVIPGKPEPKPETPETTQTPEGEPARTPPVAFPGTPAKPAARDGAQTPSHAERLRTLMRDSADPAARARALETLPLDHEAEARLDACAQGLSDPNPAVRDAALKCLLDTPGHDLFAHVIRTMAWGEAARVTALDTVLPQLAPKIASLLEETLNTELETPRHRRAAAYCLGRMGVPSAAPLLARHAWSPDGELAVTCAMALAMLRDPGALNDWLALLEHQDNAVRVLAVRALADLGTQAAWVAVRDAAAGRRANTTPAREEAARMLATLPPGDAVPALIGTMRANQAMGAPCARLLRQITGHNFGPDPEAWERGLFEEQHGAAPPAPDAGG